MDINYNGENPQIQYQPGPLINQAQTFNQSLDSMFNDVIRSKLANSQIQAQQQQIAQAKQDQAIQAGQATLANAPYGGPSPLALGQNVLQAQNQPGGMSGPFDPSNANGVSHEMMNNYIQSSRRGLELGYGKTGAETEKTSAEAANQSSEAAKNQMLMGMLGGNNQGGQPGQTGGLVNNIQQGVQSGNLPPDMALEMGGRDPLMRAAVGNTLAGGAASGQMNLTQLQAQAAGQKNAQMTQSGPQMQMAIRTRQSILPELDTLQSIAKQASGDMWQIGNKLSIAAKAEKGDGPSNDLLTQLSILKDKLNQKGPQGEQLGSTFDAATEALAAAKTKPQLLSSINLVRNSVKNEINSLQGNGQQSPAAMPKAKKQAQTGTPVINSQADYEALPSGSSYKDSIGQVYRKK